VFKGSQGDVEGINSKDVRVRWPLTVPKAGRYQVDVEYGLAPNSGGRFELQIGSAKLEMQTQPTGQRQKYEVRPGGTPDLQAGEFEAVIVPLATKGGLMNLRSIRLTQLPQFDSPKK
jgi:hypothetical protein